MFRAIPAMLLFACAGRATPEAAAPPSADDDLSVLVARLSVQHPPEDCAIVTEGLLTPAATLERAVIEVSRPPWIGLIAGRCLARDHAVAAESTLAAWLEDPKMAGLSRTLVRELPVVADEAVAVRLAQAALRGPAADVAARVVAVDPRPAVRALAP